MESPDTKNGEHAELTRSLVCRLRQGDERAAALLDTLYRARILRFGLGYLNSKEEAEDVVQEVFYRILKSETVPDSFRAWVYQITRNHCLDLLRTRKRRAENKEPDNLQVAAGVTGNLTRLVRRDQHARVDRALRSMPLHQQEVIRLRYVEGLPRAEIARVLGLPESVVKSRIYEGLETLRRQAASLDEKP